MNVVPALEAFGFGVPLAVFFGSLLLGSVLRIPPIVSLAGVFAPIALLHLDVPFVREMAGEHPEFLVMGVWIALALTALVWAAIRPVVLGATGHISFTRLCYRCVLLAALVVVVLLVFNP